MAIKEIKYGDVEQRAQTIKTYIDEASAKALTEAGSYTDKQVSVAKAYTDEKIGSIPAPDIPAALPQKYEAFEIQLPQGTNYNLEGEAPAWVEYHKTLWEGSETLTESDSGASFVSNVVLYWDAPRGYSLLITVDGAEKELKFAGVQSSQGTRWATWSYSENGTVAIQAESFGQRNGGYWNNTSTVDVYCPSGSAYIGKAMTKVRYGRKQYSYILQNPYVVLQRPTEAEATRFNTMCQNLFKQKAKVRFTLTEREIEANYVNLSEELVTTSYSEGDSGLTWLNVISDRVPLKVGSDVTDDMPTCIKGVLEVEYTDEEATKECVYDKIQGESYTFKIGDFNHEESSAFDYYFNGAILIPFSNAQIQASFTYRPVSGTEKSVQVKSMVYDGQMLPYFDISELFGQAANTVTAVITSNTAVENSDVGGRPVTTIALPSNIQNFTDANDEIMVGGILTLMPSSLPQTNVENTFTAKQTFQDVQINGNLTAKGTTTTVDVKNLEVEQQLITVAKGNTAALTSPAGLKAEKYDGTKDGALVFDASGTAMVGDVVLGADGNIDTAQSDLQDLATRAKPSELTDGHLLKWDATNKKIVDGGEASSGGTVTSVSVKMNGSVKGTVTTSGTIDLGTVVTDVSGKQDKITADNKLDVSLVNGLVAVATSGSYNDLSDKPTIPSPVTETTVSNWGFTKNAGTVTSVAVKMNSTNKGTVTGSGTIDLGTVLTSWDDVGSEAVISIIGKALYPIGAIYMSTANVNPSTFITGTTWVAWGSGKVPVGVDTNDTSFNTVEKTGGEKIHTLTESEMPKHNHTGTQSIDADVYSQKDPTAITPSVQYERKRHTADFTASTIETITAYEQGTRLATDLVEVDYGIEKGGDSAHNNLQPYITCFMFKRTV